MRLILDLKNYGEVSTPDGSVKVWVVRLRLPNGGFVRSSSYTAKRALLAALRIAADKL